MGVSMKEKLMCYIDSFDIITILLDKSIYNPCKSFYLLEGTSKTSLEILDDYDEYHFHKYIVRFIPSIVLHREYYIVDEKNNKGLLRSVSVIRTQEF